MNPLLQSVRRYAPQMKIFIRPQVSLEYLLTGNPKGETILFVHGMGCNQKCFFPNLAAFEKDWQIVTLSLRGHGGSGHPLQERNEEYTLDAFARDILELADYLGIDQFHYVGNSMGGLIGYEMLRGHDNRLLTLTTFGSPIALDVNDRLVNIGSNMLIKLSQMLGQENISTLSSELQSQNSVAYEFMRKEIFVETDFVSTHFAKLNLAHISFLTLLQQIKIPFLLLRPEKDFMDRNILPHCTELADNPLIQMVTIPGGHMANLDRPHEFEAELKRFLLQHRGL